MPDVKISAALDIGTLVSTDMFPVARVSDTSAYHATMAEIAAMITTSGVVASFNTRTGAVTLTSADVTTALGYTPYNTTNPASYVNAAGAASAAPVQSVAGHTGTVTLVHTDITDWTTTLAPYAPLASPTFTGTPTLPTGTIATTQTKGDNTTAIATTAFVLANAGAGGASITVSDTPPGSPTSGALWWDSVGGQLYLWYVDANSSQWVVANSGGALVPAASSTTPSMDGTAAIGTGTTYARADHIHPSDTSRAPLAAPVFTGDARAVTPAVGDNDTSIATTAFVQAAVGPAFNDVGRNLLHNPLFNVQQRGAGPWTAGNVYTADRWLTSYVLDVVSFSVPALTDASRSQIGDEQAAFMLGNTFTGNAGATASSSIIQRIEGVRRLAGKTVTISFWANSSAAQKIGINMTQVFGTGGSPSTAVWVLATGLSVTTAGGGTFTRLSGTIAIPSASGKTLGTNGDDYTQLALFYSSGANSNVIAGNIGVQSGTINLWGIQLEIGSVATPLEKPDPQQDLAKCQRFFCLGSILNVGYQLAGGGFQISTMLPSAMRATPTVTPLSASNTNISGFTWAALNYAVVYTVGTATAAGTCVVNASFTASADL